MDQSTAVLPYDPGRFRDLDDESWEDETASTPSTAPLETGTGQG